MNQTLRQLIYIPMVHACNRNDKPVPGKTVFFKIKKMSFVLQIEIVAGQRRIYRILSVLHVGYDFVLMTDFVLFVRFKLYLYENNFSQKLMN